MANDIQGNSKIDADDKTLLEILNEQKFTIDYFQREYRWERKHIEQLLDDLETAFMYSYDPKHKPERVSGYNSYYMGPLVMSSKEGKLSIIDGQQRLTSLTLLLIYLNHLQRDNKEQEKIDTMIFSEKFRSKSYNMQVPEREKCFDGLYQDGDYDISENDDESVQALVARYHDIEELFSEELKEGPLLYFISWLKEKVVFVKIVTYSEENAYTIFETMNDRGLNLTPTDMLKGYLLSKISGSKDKTELNAKWKKRISELHEYTQQEDLEFFKAWFRAKYAESIRPGKKGSSNEDFEKVGTYFHTWLKEKHEKINLVDPEDFFDFVDKKFDFYSKLYLRILAAMNNYNPDLSSVYYISYHGIALSLAYPLLIAPITERDNEQIQNKKLQLVAHFIDCFSVYRSVNQRTLGQSALRYTIYSLVKEIRNRTVKDLAKLLKGKITNFEEDLDGILNFNLNQQNKRFVRFFLGRITNYVENQSGINTSIDDYLSDRIKKPVQVEHIWEDNYDYFKNEFDQKSDFQFYRNKLGGLILLPQGTNQSFGKDRYKAKLPHYLKQNLLAQTLHEDCYQKNPNFTKWYKPLKLNFKSHKEFNTKDVDERTKLYEQLANIIWSPERMDEISTS